MKPTPMHAYQSVTTTRVMPPMPAPRPSKATSTAATHETNHYAAATDQHTLAMLMAARCKAERHVGRVPPSPQPENVGGRKTPRHGRDTPVADSVLWNLTPEWQKITPELCGAVGAHHESIRNTLKRLLAIGEVESKRGSGNQPTMWRIAQ